MGPGALSTGRPLRSSWDGRHLRERWGKGRVVRSRESRLFGGIAGGLAARAGVDPTLVRVGFVIVGFLWGFGVAAYVAAWLVLPLEGSTRSIGTKAVHDREGIVLAVALLPALALALVVGSLLHIGLFAQLAWPAFAVGAGGVLVWRNVEEDERAWLRRCVEPVVRIGSGTRASRRRFVLRVAAGLLLVAAGMAVLVGDRVHVSGSALRPIGGIVILGSAVAVLFGPWWVRLLRDLASERQARARAEERAEMASRVHDSVLQTLALIQRSAEEPGKVVQLARSQERELRSWLVSGVAPGTLAGDVKTLSEAIRSMAAEVEAAHGVVIEVVTVGDCALGEQTNALVGAAREATVNAAKWSGASSVSVFAEVEAARASVYVRDRGRGFEEAQVAADRRGIAESIRARMARHGGRATVRSAPGRGTEVELVMEQAGR